MKLLRVSHENVSLAMALTAAFLFTPNRGVRTEEGSRHVGVVLRKASELPGSRGELYSPCHHLTHPFRNRGVEALALLEDNLPWGWGETISAGLLGAWCGSTWRRLTAPPSSQPESNQERPDHKNTYPMDGSYGLVPQK